MTFRDVVERVFESYDKRAEDELLEWADTQTDVAAAWRSCERADWMLLGLALNQFALSGAKEFRELARLTAAVVREAVALFPDDDNWGASKNAVDAVDAWASKAKHSDAETCATYSDDAIRERSRASEQKREDLVDAAHAAAACAFVPQGSDPPSAAEAAHRAALALAYSPTRKGGAAEQALAASHRRLADLIRKLHPSADGFFVDEKPRKRR